MAEKNAMIVSSHDVVCDKKYTEWLGELKTSYRQAQIKASVKVNNERLAWYWRMGRDLVIRKAEQTWGSGVVEQLSLDLRNEFPNASGLSADNLWAMKRWYLFYAKRCADEKVAQAAQELLVQPVQEMSGEKLAQLVQETQRTEIEGNTKLAQLVQVLDDGIAVLDFPAIFSLVPWGHHKYIVNKSNSLDEAIFYIRQTVANSWSRTALQRSIEANLYQNHGGAITNFNEQLPEVQAKLAQEITKENYDFSFVTLPSEYDERDLETQLEQHISRFLLELGNGFSFVGRQKEIIVDGVSRRIDMLFYHLRLHCYVVVELKTCRFQPEFAGKLNFYVNAVDDLLKTDIDRPTIGLLICSDMKQTEVKYSFLGITTPLGVASYDNVQIAEIAKQLPTVEQLQERIKMLEDELRRKAEEKKE